MRRGRGRCGKAAVGGVGEGASLRPKGQHPHAHSAPTRPRLQARSSAVPLRCAPGCGPSSPGCPSPCPPASPCPPPQSCPPRCCPAACCARCGEGARGGWGGLGQSMSQATARQPPSTCKVPDIKPLSPQHQPNQLVENQAQPPHLNQHPPEGVVLQRVLGLHLAPRSLVLGLVLLRVLHHALNVLLAAGREEGGEGRERGVR